MKKQGKTTGIIFGFVMTIFFLVYGVERLWTLGQVIINHEPWSVASNIIAPVFMFLLAFFLGGSTYFLWRDKGRDKKAGISSECLN